MTRSEYAGLVALRAQIDALIATAEEGMQPAACQHPEDRREDAGSTWTLQRDRCGVCGEIVETPKGAAVGS